MLNASVDNWHRGAPCLNFLRKAMVIRYLASLKYFKVRHWFLAQYLATGGPSILLMIGEMALRTKKLIK